MTKNNSDSGSVWYYFLIEIELKPDTPEVQIKPAKCEVCTFIVLYIVGMCNEPPECPTRVMPKKIRYRNVQTVAFWHYPVYELLILRTLKHFSHGGFCVPHLTAVGHIRQRHEGTIDEIEDDLGVCKCVCPPEQFPQQDVQQDDGGGIPLFLL